METAVKMANRYNFLVRNYGIKVFLLFYGVILCCSSFFSYELLYFLITLKCLLVVLFAMIVFDRPISGLNLFFFICILLGFNGNLQRILGDFYLSVIFLGILGSAVILKQENRQNLFYAFRVSSFRGVLFLSCIAIPLYGFMWGLIRGNNFVYILKDADGWIFYSLIFIMMGLIDSKDKFRSWLKTFLLAIICSVLLHLVLLALYKSGHTSSEFIRFFCFSLLNLGGHFSDVGFPVTRLYTGSGIFSSFLIIYVLLGLTFSQVKRKPFYLLAFLCVCLSLLLQYTRGFWFSSIVAIFLFVIFIPSRREKLYFCLFFTVLLGLFYYQSFVFDFSLAHIIKVESAKLHEATQEIESEMYAGKEWKRKKSKLGGDFSTTLKAKQYHSLIRHTNKKPLTGYGFGATLPSNTTFRNDNGFSPYNFEAGYGNLLLKVGYLGFLLWFSLIMKILFHSLKIILTFSHEQKLIVSLFVFPFTGILVTYATNPYMFSPFGIIPLLVTTFVVDFVLRHKESDDSPYLQF